MRRGFLWRVALPIALGVLLGLSTASGQPPMEGSWGKEPVPPVVSQIGREFYYRVDQEQTFDFKGIQFFHLKSADGTAMVSVDGDVDLAAALKAFDGQRVRLTLEPATLVLKKVER